MDTSSQLSTGLPNEERPVAPPTHDKFEIAYAAIWLVFLVPSLLDAALGLHSLPIKAAGVALVVAFATLYIYGFHAYAPVEPRGFQTLQVFMILGGLIALLLTFSALIGWEALGWFTFVAAGANLLLPLRWSIVVSTTIISGAVVLPFAIQQSGLAWGFSASVIFVTAVTMLIRVLDGRRYRMDALRSELLLSDERSRVARDVHDVLGHSLTVVSLKTELCRRLLSSDDSGTVAPAKIEQCRAELDQIRAISVQALDEVRATVAGLKSARLDEELHTALRVLKDSGIDAHVVGRPDIVAPDRRAVLGWVLREAVTNVVRHAAADRCTITIDVSGMTVADNGIGIPETTPDQITPRRGNGLAGLAKRMTETGGILTVGNVESCDTDPPTTGTQLRAEWPPS